MKTIAIANQKGGVGKTTTAVNLSACLSRMGQRVLLVDLDPQANATDHLGQANPEDEAASSYALIAEKTPDFGKIIIPVSPNLQLAPGHIALAEMDLKLHNAINRETRLQRCLKLLQADFDYVVIDCAPNLGVTTVNAFCAATHVLIAIQTNWFAYEALRRLTAIINEVIDESNPELIVFALATLHRTNVNVNREVLAQVRQDFEDLTLETTIPYTATLVEASANHQTILDYAHGSKAHRAYEQLAEEIIRRVERPVQQQAQAQV
jgi:chromosome partitioning protein